MGHRASGCMAAKRPPMARRYYLHCNSDLSRRAARPIASASAKPPVSDTIAGVEVERWVTT